MAVRTEKLALSTRGDAEITDITPRLADATASLEEISSGIVTVFVPGSTGALTTVEYEPGLVDDLQAMFDRLCPRDIDYEHERRWHDGNGHSHCRASLLGPSLTIPFNDRQLILGTWQQVVFIDFDNRERERELVLQYIGE